MPEWSSASGCTSSVAESDVMINVFQPSLGEEELAVHQALDDATVKQIIYEVRAAAS
jgi:hypothetical protein